MRLPGLVIAVAVLLLILGVASGWWILGQSTDLKPNPTIAPPPPGATDSSTNKTAMLWLIWYGDDTAIYRLRVDATDYEDLYATLRQSLAQDQMRMESIAVSHLSATLTPIFAELPPRLEPFLDDLFDVSSSATFLGQAMSIAAESVATANPSSESIALKAGESTRSRLADMVVTRFRDAVLLPGFTMRALRSANGRAFSMTRQDLLEDCDRYDRAFRSFVLKTPGTVESRDGELGWRPDPSWQQGNASFLSLCPELRRTDAGQLPDAPLVEAFTAAEETIRAQALELVRPLTDTSVDIAMRAHATTASLNAYGLPTSLASTLATGVTSLSSAITLVKRSFDQLGGTPGRERFSSGLKATLDSLQADSIQSLHSLYRNFIAVEMERIGLNLAARSEGAWSHADAQ